MKDEKIGKIYKLYKQLDLTEVECLAIVAAVLYTQDKLKASGNKEDSLSLLNFRESMELLHLTY